MHENDKEFMMGADTLFWTHLLLFIKQINNLQIINNVYHLKDLPLQFVQVCGIVTSVQRKSTFTALEISDGTGTLPCCVWKEDFVCELGDILTLSGKLTLYQDQTQLNAHYYEKGNFETELLHWLRVIELNKIYMRPREPQVLDPFPAIEQKQDQDPLKNVLALNVQDRVGEFSFDDLCQDQYLIHEISGLTDTNPKLALAKACRSLIKDGLIYQKSEENDVFEVVNVNNLGTAIIEVIKKEESVNGMYLDEIAMCVRKIELFKSCPRSKIKLILTSLLNEKRIVKLPNSKYNIV